MSCAQSVNPHRASAKCGAEVAARQSGFRFAQSGPRLLRLRGNSRFLQRSASQHEHEEAYHKCSSQEQNRGYRPIAPEAAVNHDLALRIVGEIEHDHLVSPPMARWIASKTVLEFDRHTFFRSKLDHCVINRTGVVARFSLQSHHFAVSANARRFQASASFML